jgi:predicted Zn-ribbon and HTH transcriptional regulator
LRKDPVLVQRDRSVSELAERRRVHPKDIESYLDRLLRSLNHEPSDVRIAKARCCECGFGFGARRLRTPGKFPRYHGTSIAPPGIHLTEMR